MLKVNSVGTVGMIDIVSTSSGIASSVTIPTSQSSNPSVSIGTMYLLNMSNTSGFFTFSLPDGEEVGEEIWIAENSATNAHANKFAVSGKLFDTGSTIWTFGGVSSGANYKLQAKTVLKWMWTGSYWIETTNSI